MHELGTKTPVSFLQEYGVAKKMMPDYKLTHQGGASHSPQFTFRVQLGALWEEGTGSTKQQAKHRAAEKMLRTLKFLDFKEDFKSEESNETSYFKKEPRQNYVGQLKDLCQAVHYPEPLYYLEEEAGPSHDKVFKMVCCVSQLKEFGISKTKKQAKHEAASKMLQRLKEVSGKKIEDCLSNLEVQNRTAALAVTDQGIIDKYKSLKSTKITEISHEDPVALYKDNHKAYIPLREASPTLDKILNESNSPNIGEHLSVMKDIAKELGSKLETVETPTKNSQVKFILMTMSPKDAPPLGAVGVNEKEAAHNLLKSLLVLSKD